MLVLHWLQAGPGRVLIEQLSGPPKPVVRLATSLRLAGLDVTSGALLLHDGKQAEVHKISDVDNTTSLLSQFEGPGLPVPDAAAANAETARVSAPGAASGACAMALYNDSVYRTAERRVEVCNLSGGPLLSSERHTGGCNVVTAACAHPAAALELASDPAAVAGVVKQTLPFEESQGQPLLLDTNNEFLAVLTSKGVVRVFKLAGREAKPHAGPGEPV